MLKQDMSIGESLSYYRMISNKYIGDFEIVKITHKYDEDTGVKYPIYHLIDEDEDTIMKCDSRNGDEIGAGGMWYFENVK